MTGHAVLLRDSKNKIKLNRYTQKSHLLNVFEYINITKINAVANKNPPLQFLGYNTHEETGKRSEMLALTT